MNLFESLQTRPQPGIANPESIKVLLKAQTSISHGDTRAGASGANNTTLFCRELMRVERACHGVDEASAKAAITSLLNQCALGESVIPFLESLSGSELIAVLFTAQYPILYSAGEGLFNGVERYNYLTTRLTDGAASCSTLATLWGYTAKKLQLSIFAEKHFDRMKALFSLPQAIQSKAIKTILQSIELTVMGAREIATSSKLTNVNYAMAANEDVQDKSVYEPSERQIADLTSSGSESLFIFAPSVSGNAMRHCLLREPGITRLLQELELEPFANAIPEGVLRFLYSGGNTAKGASAPGDADVLEVTARLNYPIIDALGGATDQFVFNGEGRAKIAAWIVCKENNAYTGAIVGVESDSSVFDMIEETTRTRSGFGGSDKQSGQMIFSYETLAKGVEVLAEISFVPFTSPLTIGATAQALLDYDGLFGGRSAEGHGRFDKRLIAGDQAGLASVYLEYLRTNKERLIAGLKDKTFNTEKVLCAA